MDKIFSPIKGRVCIYLEYKGINKEIFFANADISASNFKGKGAKSELGGDKIVKILTIYNDLNPEWLILGYGNMLKSDIKDEAPSPTQENIKNDIYYNMYKEQQKEIRSLLEEIGVLKERLRQYQSQIETFQDLPSIRSDSANNTGNQKKYISKKDVTAPNATKELVKNASKHDSKISAATSVAVNSTKQQSGTKKKV